MDKSIIKYFIVTILVICSILVSYPKYEIVYDSKKEFSVRYNTITGKAKYLSVSRMGGYEWNEIKED